jgi:hypothetical protein
MTGLKASLRSRECLCVCARMHVISFVGKTAQPGELYRASEDDQSVAVAIRFASYII